MKDFQGLKNFAIDFNDEITEILGENGTGKTTILDGIYWLFFDKNSLGNKKFDLFPLDDKNEIIKNTKPTVELNLEINDKTVSFKKIKSKSTTYFIDEIPKKAAEFNEFVSSLISEKLFMTLINPVFFGGSYKWNEQKSIILDNFQVEDTVIQLPEYEVIKTDIISVGVDDTKNKYNSKRKELEKNIDKDNGTKEYISNNLKYKKIDVSKEDLILQKEMINKQISEYDKSLSKVYELRGQLVEVNSKIQKLENEKLLNVSQKKEKVSQKKSEKNRLLKEYKKLSNELKLVEDTCSLCGSKLNPQKVQAQKDSLKEKIENIIASGKLISNEIEVLEVEFNRLSGEENINSKVSSKKQKIEKQIESMQKIVNVEKLNELKTQLSDLNNKITSYDLINKLNKDLEEVNSKISKNTNTLDDVEMKLNLIKEYHKEYSELVADELNSKLENVQIKTFTTQKNGDIKETFEITMNGVPYSSLNSAGKIIAGIELIQLIKKCLNINFPIIIDNKESITKDFNIDNQVITLTVVKGVKLGV